MIRTYRPSDLDAIREITVICFDGTSIDQNIEKIFGKIGGKDWRWRKARTADADARVNPEGIFVYEDGGKAAGYIATRIDPESKIGWVSNLAVLPDYQGKGIGKALMAAALDSFEAGGMQMAKIEVLEQNAVGPIFYPRAGFREVARQIHYIMPLKDRKL